MNELSKVQLIIASISSSAVFFLLLYAVKRVFNAELKGDWGLVVVAAFPFLAYSILNILSTDILKKEVNLSAGFVNIKLIEDRSTTEKLELSFGQNVDSDESSATKGTGAEISRIIDRARRDKLTTLMVDAGKYIIDLRAVDKYASKSGYLFRHIVFVKGEKFLGYATPEDIDRYVKSGELAKSNDFWWHLGQMPLQTDILYDTTSELKAFEVMSKRNIDIVAVIDSKTAKYLGLASKKKTRESMLTQLLLQVGKAKFSKFGVTQE